MRNGIVQLQSILLPGSSVCDEEKLYYHKEKNRIDFNGYFNLFYIEKRKRYSSIRNLYLKLRMKGFESLILVHDGKDIGKFDLDAEHLLDYQVPFPYDKFHDGCFWFALVRGIAEVVSSDHVCSGETSCPGTEYEECNVSGFYVAEQEPDRIRDVRLGVVICSYKREQYVERNLRQIKKYVFDRTELDVSARMKIYIIDNGNTLNRSRSVSELVDECAGRVQILPNRNTGGAGGFTRGMLEVIREKDVESFTHVLLIDDDAVPEPDAFVRICGLASTIQERWKDATIGGAILREDYPYVLSRAGEQWISGRIIAQTRNLDLRQYCQASDPYLTKTGHEREMYSAWGMCCYSLCTVRRDNLPLPLFLHMDDVEYGLRNRMKGVLYLNGISVWHRGSETDYSGANVYYDIRNSLVTMALHQDRKAKMCAIKFMWRILLTRMVRYRYDEARLAYSGLEDFLRGPAWLLRQNPEILNKRIRDAVYGLKPMESLRRGLSEKEYQSVCIQIREQAARFGIDSVNTFWKEKKNIVSYIFATCTSVWNHRKNPIVFLMSDSSSMLFPAPQGVYYDMGSGKVMLMERKVSELIFCCYLCLKSAVRILLDFDAVRAAYRRQAPMIATRKTWEKYLGI